MEESKKIIIELTDLPNFRDSFAEPLTGLGITTIDDLRQVLMDDERTASMISGVNGLGPKTVQGWKDALEGSEELSESEMEEAEEPVIEEETEESDMEETSEPASEEVEPSAEEAVTEPIIEEETEQVVEEAEGTPVQPPIERNLACTMKDLKGIQKTLIELLEMNGSKKKGITASVNYVTKRLTSAGMDVKVDKESGVPTIIASKGKGGFTLWGHLDTDRMDGMKQKEQGTILEGLINGRGAANMKGAVAAMICAAERAAYWNIPFSIVLTTDGLYEQMGAEALAKDPVVEDSRGILMLGPTGMRPIVGQVGYAALLVRVSGDRAVMDMAKFLNDLSGRVAESSGKMSVDFGMIRGGKRRRPFDPAQSCEVVMEMETMEGTGSMIKMVEELLMGMEYDSEVLCQSDMVEFDTSSDIANAIAEVTEKETVFAMVYSEAGKIVSANQKIVICGPGTEVNALSDHEYVTIRELEQTYETLLRLLDWSAPQ